MKCKKCKLEVPQQERAHSYIHKMSCSCGMNYNFVNDNDQWKLYSLDMIVDNELLVWFEGDI